MFWEGGGRTRYEHDRTQKVEVTVGGNVFVTHKMSGGDNSVVLQKLDQILGILASGGLSADQIEQLRRITSKVEEIHKGENE